MEICLHFLGLKVVTMCEANQVEVIFFKKSKILSLDLKGTN